MDMTEYAPRLVADDKTLPPTIPVANNVAMKLPAFWPDAAEVGFAQTDAQFEIKAVTIWKTKLILSRCSSSPSRSRSPDPQSDPSSPSLDSLRGT